MAKWTSLKQVVLLKRTIANKSPKILSSIVVDIFIIFIFSYQNDPYTILFSFFNLSKEIMWR